MAVGGGAPCAQPLDVTPTAGYKPDSDIQGGHRGIAMRQVSARTRALRHVRDPRLVLGTLLVLGSTVLGARVVAAADDTLSYWALAHDVQAGHQLQAGDLVPARAHLSGTTADAHVLTTAELPGRIESLVWARDARAGSLLTADALVAKADASRRELPVAVAWGSAPDDLAVGDVVDVWVGPAPGERGGGEAARVLAGVLVASVGEDGAAAGGAVARTVVLAVDPDSLSARSMADLTAGHVTLVGVP